MPIYVAGYAVECALKSCLLARTVYTGWVFQDKAKINDCLTHDFGDLVNLSGLTAELNAQLASNPTFVANWGTTIQWKVTDRYGNKTEAEAKALYAAITDDPRWGAEMDYELLVDERIEDGKSLLAGLVEDGFDVSVALWVKTSEEGRWFLYVGSTTVRTMSIGEAYRAIYGALRRIPHARITLSDLKLVDVDNPIARAAIEVRDRLPARLPTRYKGERLGNLAIEEAYIYPPTGAMSRSEILQTITGLIDRRGAFAPSIARSRWTTSSGSGRSSINSPMFHQGSHNQ